MRPALRVAHDRIGSAFGHLTTGLQWLAGTLDEELAKSPSIHYALACAIDAFEEAGDIADLMPTCIRCEVSPATDGDYCAGCHDFVGERQDERAAS